MIKFRLTFLLLISASILNSQSISKACVINDIFSELFSIQKLEFEGRVFFAREVNQIDSTSCFSETVNNNSRHLNYLLTNFSDKSNYEELIVTEDSIELYNKFISDLHSDSSFVALISEYLVKPAPYPTDTITFDELLNIAVKFFNINKITKEGYYSGKVCTGINLLESTEKKRSPQVEAFCFASIFDNYMSDKYKLREKFVSHIKSLYKINLGVDTDERLLRAQGALFVLMANDEALKESLLNDYKEKSKYLPFVVLPE